MQLLAPNLLCREIIQDSLAAMFAKDHLDVLTLSVRRHFSKMASCLALQEHAPTLQDDFALPRCLTCLEITLRFHGQDAP